MIPISDYAGHEGEIDWTKTEVSREEAYSINLVDEFHGGCGMKEQEDQQDLAALTAFLTAITTTNCMGLGPF